MLAMLVVLGLLVMSVMLAVPTSAFAAPEGHGASVPSTDEGIAEARFDGARVGDGQPAGAQSVDVQDNALVINQAFKTTGELPPSVTGRFDYELLASSDDAPLPASAQDGVFSFSLSGDGASLALPVVSADCGSSSAFAPSPGSSGAVSIPGAASGSASSSLAGASGSDALIFAHAGVYSYALRCVSPAEPEGMKVDETVFSVRLSMENSADGLRLGWIEVRNSFGAKLDRVEFSHSFAGTEPDSDVQDGPGSYDADDSGADNTKRGGLLSWFPRTGDPLWGLLVVSGAMCIFSVFGLLLFVLARRRRRRHEP